MARTKASVGAKVSSGKSSKARCSAAPSTNYIGTSAGAEKSRSSGGGNSVCHRETPKWQRPITNFFIQTDKPDDDAPAAGSSKSKPKRNFIESDDEESPQKSTQEKNTEKSTPEKTKEKSTPEKNAEKSTPEKSTPEKTEKSTQEKVDVENSPTKSPIGEEISKKSPPKNCELDETIELEELTGDNSHKLEEYYPKESKKGKGIGKKSKGKENLNNNNVAEIRSGKRDREDNSLEENSSKKIKIN